MAPVKPRPKSNHSTTTTYPSSSTSAIPSTKRDKRTIKHSALLSRIAKSSAKPLKRRRPSKKLATTLDALGDALPDVADAATAEEQAARLKDEAAGRGGAARARSLKTRPGSMKRKVKVEQAERERMGLNLAQLAKVRGAEGGGLQALKRHLQAQMGGG